MAIRTPGPTGSPDFSLGGFLIMLQAQIFDHVPFISFSYRQNGLRHPKVQVGWR
jgi:hypothetical protein